MAGGVVLGSSVCGEVGDVVDIGRRSAPRSSSRSTPIITNTIISHSTPLQQCDIINPLPDLTTAAVKPFVTTSKLQITSLLSVIDVSEPVHGPTTNIINSARISQSISRMLSPPENLIHSHNESKEHSLNITKVQPANTTETSRLVPSAGHVTAVTQALKSPQFASMFLPHGEKTPTKFSLAGNHATSTLPISSSTAISHSNTNILNFVTDSATVMEGFGGPSGVTIFTSSAGVEDHSRGTKTTSSLLGQMLRCPLEQTPRELFGNEML